MTEFIPAFSKGIMTGFTAACPAEWLLHKEVLHAKQKVRNKIKFVDMAALGHHDNHHGAYKGPAHYYRDITNQDEVIHFSKSDVGLIAAVSTAVGGLISGAFYLTGEEKNLTGFASYTGGFLAGVMAYYGAYEFTHHYMHVIGERRLAINRVLGDKIQGGINKRDGNLRISKPLLDDICNSIETAIDSKFSSDDNSILNSYQLGFQLQNQVATNKGNRNSTNLSPSPMDTILYETLDIMLERESSVREKLDIGQKLKYAFQRKLQSTLRASPFFQKLDNHHFFHHFRYDRNLNVVLPAMDYLAGTKEESGVEKLNEDRRLWLCPNSPEVAPFERKILVRA